MLKTQKNYIIDALKDLNFKSLTAIQEAVIPEILKGSDIIASSKTGSGKSHAFLIPIFEKLDENHHDLQIVILSPTRELATQLYDVASHIASFSKSTITIGLYTGGKDRQKEIQSLKSKQPHIVIGTPGKINDLAFKENVLSVYKAKILVIDEADMALDIGFLPEIDAIARVMPKELQMLVFSATIPEKLKPFLRKYLKHPKEINFEDKSLKDLNLNHTFIRTTENLTKDKALDDTIKKINPYLAMIFVNKKEDVERLYKRLYQEGLNVTMLHGDMPARKRKQVLKEINRLTYQYIVASDMASRGLDIEGISHIINYDLPKDMAFFVHRIGRSGRMGASGDTISFYTDKDNHALEFIDKHKIDVNFIGNKPIRAIRQSRKSIPSKSTMTRQKKGRKKQ
ncbi:MAG: DEAD/DEAH box helicase [Candidatus Izemoplasmataceae bacterium]